MAELLREKILLEEPEGQKDLPDAVPTEPIEVSTEPAGELEKVRMDGLYSILSSELSNTYNHVSELKSILATFEADMPDRKDVTDILNGILDDRTMHIGMLQSAMDILDPRHGELIDAGEGKAEAIAGE